MLHYKTQWKSLTSKFVRQQLPFILKSQLQNQTMTSLARGSIHIK